MRICRPSWRTTSLPLAASSPCDATSIHAIASRLLAGTLIDRGDAIDAAPGAGQDVLVANDPRRVAQHAAEDVELGAAESLAARRRRADRAVILDEEKAIALCAPFGHIAFARAQG